MLPACRAREEESRLGPLLIATSPTKKFRAAQEKKNRAAGGRRVAESGSSLRIRLAPRMNSNVGRWLLLAVRSCRFAKKDSPDSPAEFSKFLWRGGFPGAHQ